MYFQVLRRQENLLIMKKCDVKQIQCKQCGFCCRNLKKYSIMIFPEDIRKLSENLAITENEFIESYCEFDDMLFEDERIHICYLKTDNIDCPFLRENLCTIHSQKPIQCKRTPYHFFAYYDIWGYMPCVNKNNYPEGKSYIDDIELIKKFIEEK